MIINSTAVREPLHSAYKVHYNIYTTMFQTEYYMQKSEPYCQNTGPNKQDRYMWAYHHLC